MKLFCRYFQTVTKLEFALGNLYKKSTVNAFSVEGGISHRKENIKLSGDPVSIVCNIRERKEGTYDNTLYMFLTTDTAYKGYDTKVLDIDDVAMHGVWFSIHQMLSTKAKTTGNKCQLDLEVLQDEPMSLSLIYTADNSECVVSTGDNSIVSRDEDTIQQLLEKDLKITEFSYISAQNGYKRHCSISGSVSQIFREMSHFLNSTVVLVNLNEDDGSIYEVAIDSTAVISISTPANGNRFWTKTNLYGVKINPIGIYSTVKTVRDLKKEIAEEGRTLMEV